MPAVVPFLRYLLIKVIELCYFLALVIHAMLIHLCKHEMTLQSVFLGLPWLHFLTFRILFSNLEVPCWQIKVCRKEICAGTKISANVCFGRLFFDSLNFMLTFFHADFADKVH